MEVRVIEASVAKEAWREKDVERIEYISADYESIRVSQSRCISITIGHVTFLPLRLGGAQ